MERIKDKGFLKLPDIINIKNRPDDPYTGGHEGRIHAQKFIRIFEYLMGDGSWESVLDEFDGHVFQTFLKQSSKGTLADFCRHFLIANKDKIDWEVVDELLDKLDKKNYTPGWELPNTELYNDLLGDIYSSMINIRIESTISRIFNDIIKGFEELDIYHVDLKSKIQSKFQVWNFKDLLELYALLHDPEVLIWFEKRDINVRLLTNKITRIFIQTIEDSNTTRYQKIGLSVLFLKEYTKQGKEALVKSQELIEAVWKEIDKLSTQEKISFRTLLGATYSYLILQIFNSQSNFITRRRLLGRIISNYITSKDFDISKWFLSLVSSNVRPEAVSYILRGYYSFIVSLNHHILELPKGEIRNKLEALSKSLTRDVKVTIFSYLENYYGLPDLENTDAGMYYYNFTKLDLNTIMKKEFEKLLIQIVEVQLSLGSYVDSDQPFEHELNLVRTIYEKNQRDKELIIFNLVSEILLNRYPFHEIYETILKEFMETDTIILSETFEKEVINNLSLILDFLLKSEEVDNDYRRTIHELLIVFIGEWLNVFSQQVDLFNDAFMLLTPIVSINFIQIIREYFVKNNINKAFLTYLNMHYFTEYCVYEIKKSEIWKVSDSNSPQRTKISKKFNSMIEEWQIEDLLNIEDIKRSVTNIEMTIAGPEGATSQTLAGMIEDEIVLGYLKRIENLEEFISLSSDHKDKNTDNKRNLVDDLKILYDSPSYTPLNVFSLIGYTNIEEGREELPFPLIREIHEYTIALDFFPIDTSFIDIIGNENLFESIMEIMSFTKE